MTKVYLATKQEVQNVEQSVTTINTQINTADTGIDARVQALEGNNTELFQLRTDVDAVDEQLNDPVTGLVKAVTVLDAQINEEGTGVIARLDDLEQGGTSTTKLRKHSISGKYEDGELVQRARNFGRGEVMCIYRANGAIDGSDMAVAFVEGTESGTWTELSPAGAEFGDVKHGYQKYDHGGWWIMNGRSVSTISAKAQQAAYLLGITSNLPDMRNKTVFGSMNESGLGGTAGSNTISRNNLPIAGLTFSGTSDDNNRDHTHKVDPPSTSTNTTGSHSHTVDYNTAVKKDGDPDGAADTDATSGYWRSGNISVRATVQKTGSHTHSVDIAEFDSGGASQKHTHTFSGTTESMNGGDTQVPFMQAHLRLNYFIYLGV